MKIQKKLRNRFILCFALVLPLGAFASCSPTGENNNSGENGSNPGGNSNPGGDNNPGEAKTVTISFDTGVSGVSVAPISGKVGDPVPIPNPPQAIERTFVCWLLNGVQYQFSVFPETDITLVAKWETNSSNFYTVRFDTGDSSTSQNVRVAPNEYVSPIQVGNKSGQVFRCWTLNNNYFNFTTPITSNITLTAKWVEKTNLATVLIELYGSDGKLVNISNVGKDTPVSSSITIYDQNGTALISDAVSNFKGRGNGSWNKPKKGYKIKLDKKADLFGRTANKHWVIVPCQNFPDNTMLINYTAYTMGRTIFDNIEYSPYTVWTDVYINGAYYGVYDFTEHLRVAKGRVNIDSQYGVEDTGYLVELDALATQTRKDVDYFGVTYTTTSSGSGGRPGSTSTTTNNYTVHSPSPEDYETEGQITQAQFKTQVAYIKNKLQEVYTSICNTTKNYSTFSELVDIDSLVDMYILEEFYKNSDVGHSSLYLYKKPGGKFYFGPPWDFDWAGPHSSDSVGKYNGTDNGQDIYIAGNVKNKYAIFTEAYKVSEYLTKVKQRWKVLSPKIQEYANSLFTNDFYAANRYALGRNFVKWPRPESDRSTQAQWETKWIEACNTFKTWYTNRINYLNSARAI